jgi:hypothetical protein
LLLLCVLLGTMPVSCSPSLHIVVDGTAKRLPPPETRVAVWGLRPVVTDTVVQWLQRQRLIVLEPAKLQELFDRDNIRVSRSFADERHALRMAKELGVSLVVFTESAIGETVVSSPSAVAGTAPFPGTVPTAFSSASVTVRGVEVASGELAFSATARYPQQLDVAGPDTLAMLACRALETAWGLHLPGEQALDPDEAC